MFTYIHISSFCCRTPSTCLCHISENYGIVISCLVRRLVPLAPSKFLHTLYLLGMLTLHVSNLCFGSQMIQYTLWWRMTATVLFITNTHTISTLYLEVTCNSISLSFVSCGITGWNECHYYIYTYAVYITLKKKSSFHSESFTVTLQYFWHVCILWFNFFNLVFKQLWLNWLSYLLI